MATIADILRTKGRSEIFSVPPETSVFEATRLMNAASIGSVLVIESLPGRGRRHLAGIFTERDVLRRVVAAGRSPKTTSVSEVMTPDVIRCDVHASVADVAEQMRRQRIRHIPVIDHTQPMLPLPRPRFGGGLAEEFQVVGLISMGDINAWRFNACEVALHEVENYIHCRA
jgi:CBS domain-containing protein